jgi:hypothetical protein
MKISELIVGTFSEFELEKLRKTRSEIFVQGQK